jgi:cell shape-determining protein MreD
VPFNLLFLGLLAMVIIRESKPVIVEAFIFSILLDFLNVNSLGSTGFIILPILFFVVVIKELYLVGESKIYSHAKVRIDIVILNFVMIIGLILDQFWLKLLNLQTKLILIDLKGFVISAILLITFYFIFLTIETRGEEKTKSQLQLFRNS